MPGMNGTGPTGQGPKTGRAMGRCAGGTGIGRGMGMGRRTGGRGRGLGMGGGQGFGFGQQGAQNQTDTEENLQARLQQLENEAQDIRSRLGQDND